MKSIKILLICFFIALVKSTYAQNVKPAFRTLTYVAYTTEADKVVIKDIIEINNKGQAHYRSVWYKGIADTTYQLTDERLTKLNAIFNGRQPLKKFMVRTHLREGRHFGGSYDYVTFTLPNGKTEQFTIASPLMSDDFNDAFDKLAIMPSKVSYAGKSISNPGLEKQMLILEKQSTYLPKIEEPPSVKDLGID